MDISLLSESYTARRLFEEDIEEICALCRQNTLYYEHCPPFVSRESILEDMKALPPGTAPDDKYYIGFYDISKLIAVMDLIMNYPDSHTAYIGFFMTRVSVQNSGTGSRIIEEMCSFLKESGIKAVRLAWVSTNPQAAHFWLKNGFTPTNEKYETEQYTLTAARRIL